MTRGGLNEESITIGLTRIAKGLEFTEEHMERSMQTIVSCAASGHYLTDRSTLNEHRRIFWTPSLFDYSLLRTSRLDTDIIERAKEICRKKIEEHEYQLEEKKTEKLVEIYDEARNNLC